MMTAVPSTRPGRPTKALLARAAEVQGQLGPDHDPVGAALQSLRAAVRPAVDEMVLAHLMTVDVDRMKTLADGNLQVGRLKQAGFKSVAQVLNAPSLSAYPGIGEKTAREARGAAHQLANIARDNLRFRLDPDRRPQPQTQLLRAVAHHERVIAEAPKLLQVAGQWRRALNGPIQAAQPATQGIRFRFRKSGRDEALAAVLRLEELLADKDLEPLVDRIQNLFVLLPVGDADLWARFRTDAASVYAHLDEHTDLDLGGDHEGGQLPAEIIEAVRRQPLDTGHLNVSLRGYQSFGARYALVQSRTLLGDEMGLGKTLTALAVAAHLRSMDKGRALVVCPASVLHNWGREVASHSRLRGWFLHGPERWSNARKWLTHGGVGITTFDTLGSLDGPHRADLLVVDEAHYVKNRRTKRAKNVESWTSHAERVLYMTGTPLENNVDEFRSLVAQLQPHVAATLHDQFALAGTDGFRNKVAPVYLRRNQEDVLTELPDRLEAEDWVEMTDRDLCAYRGAVASKNFMAMRRAAWSSSSPSSCAKMARLVDIVEESSAQGWKVVIFSFFLDTLRVITDGLNTTVFGPLTGALPPPARQQLVDDFSTHDGPAVLVSQITAGGVGLNIQAASVVVLAEPQWKPSVEEQAVARCHRMGQTRRVHVHRLLTEPGVDQRMVELVAGKAAIFDAYARQSSIKDRADEATDRSHVAMAQQIIDEELGRLGLEDDPNQDPVLF